MNTFPVLKAAKHCPIFLIVGIITVGTTHNLTAMHRDNTPHIKTDHRKNSHWKNTYKAQFMAVERNQNAQELFMEAFDNGGLGTMQQALNAGANINVGRNGLPPIITAISNHDATLVKWLIQHHANVDLPDENGTTALMYAIASRNRPIINLLAPHADLYAKEDTDCKAFDYAVQIPDGKDIAHLLEIYAVKQVLDNETLRELGINPRTNDYGNADKPLLLRVVEHGCYDAAVALLNLGVDPNIIGPKGLTPLMAATHREDHPTIELLLDNNAVLEICDAFGQNAWNYAITHGDIITVDLMDEHAIKNARTHSQESTEAESISPSNTENSQLDEIELCESI